MAGKRHVNAALERLAAAEADFLASRFLAPVLRGHKVQVRVAGVRCQLSVEPPDFQGWGSFRPVTHAAAKLDRPATMAERRKYLELFPALWVVLCRQEGDDWLALPAGADSRFRIDGPMVVHLAEDVDLFDTVRVRFDGISFWFDQPDARTDPGAAAYLRRALTGSAHPGSLSRPGLSAQQVNAYSFVHDEQVRRQRIDQRRQAEDRLGKALSHAGATLRDFSQRGGVYRVSYEVDGRRHTSLVRKDDLTVASAGVCLSGGDENFDLHSLVGVLREGEREGLLRGTGHDE